MKCKKEMFTMRVFKQRNKLLREVMETFGVRLGQALSDLLESELSLLVAGGLDQGPLKAISNPKYSVILSFCRVLALGGDTGGESGRRRAAAGVERV